MKILAVLAVAIGLSAPSLANAWAAYNHLPGEIIVKDGDDNDNAWFNNRFYQNIPAGGSAGCPSSESTCTPDRVLGSFGRTHDNNSYCWAIEPIKSSHRETSGSGENREEYTVYTGYIYENRDGEIHFYRQDNKGNNRIVIKDGKGKVIYDGEPDLVDDRGEKISSCEEPM